MEDLIDRQAALDAMETWDKFGCDPDGKLVRYDDDKHYIPYVHYEDMVHAIKHLPSVQQWIPCSERMPEENIPILLGVRFKDDFKYFVTTRVDYNYWTGLGRNIRGKLAWMPLPEPWRGEKDD